MEVNGAHQLFGYRHSSKYLLCSAEQRNSFRSATRASKWWQNYPFQVEYPFKLHLPVCPLFIRTPLIISW